MSDPHELNAMTFTPHPVLTQGAVLAVSFLPEVGPRLDVWAIPATEVVSVEFA